MIDVRKLVEDSASMLMPQAVADVEVSVKVTGEALTVSGDRVQLHQVLLNLMLNAIDAMGQTPAGSKRLTVSAGNALDAPIVCTAPVKISGFDPSRYVYIAVADTGCGIPAESIDRIFDRFFRCDASRKYPGNGLGLSLVHAFANAHNWTIECQSTIGEGTSFLIKIPKITDQKLLIANNVAPLPES